MTYGERFSDKNAWRLVSLLPLPAEGVAGLVRGLPVEVVLPLTDDRPGALAALADADLLLADWRVGPGLDAAAVAAAPHLAFVQQPSVGVQAHDLDAVAAAGVPLSNVAGVNAVSVAEWVLGATIAVARSLVWAEAELRAGRWPQTDVIARGACEVSGRRVGLVGFGPVGQALATRFAALGCPVAYWSRRRRGPAEELGATYRDLPDLLAGSDVLVNAIALGPSTRGLLGAAEIARLPRGAILVSVSRGGIVDEDAVVSALADGRLLGAAFDVYATEPLPADSPLRSADRVLLTPHTAGSTVEAGGALFRGISANLRRAVTGEPVLDVVNGVDPVVRRRR